MMKAADVRLVQRTVQLIYQRLIERHRRRVLTVLAVSGTDAPAAGSSLDTIIRSVSTLVCLQ
jgi:hypothetical protein